MLWLNLFIEFIFFDSISNNMNKHHPVRMNLHFGLKQRKIKMESILEKLIKKAFLIPTIVLNQPPRYNPNRKSGCQVSYGYNHQEN